MPQEERFRVQLVAERFGSLVIKNAENGSDTLFILMVEVSHLDADAIYALCSLKQEDYVNFETKYKASLSQKDGEVVQRGAEAITVLQKTLSTKHLDFHITPFSIRQPISYIKLLYQARKHSIRGRLYAVYFRKQVSGLYL